MTQPMTEIQRANSRGATHLGWLESQLDHGRLVPVASGRGDHAAISIRQKDAVLWVGRLDPDSVVHLPDAQFLHVYVARGGAEVEGVGQLNTGDAARLTAAGPLSLKADSPTGAEVLVWEMNRELSGY